MTITRNFSILAEGAGSANNLVLGSPTGGTQGTGTLNAQTVYTNGNAMSPFGFKNRILNGAMQIDQRNSGSAVTPSASGYVIDSWKLVNTQTSKITLGQNYGGVSLPAGASYYFGSKVTTAHASGTTDYCAIQTNIEGYNVGDLAWGTASAKTVTLSFYVYSSVTGTFGGSIQNSAQNRSYPFTYTISSANTWTSIQVTIPGDTTGTWLTNNGAGMYIWFSLGAGSTYSGTAGSWAGANYNSATGATDITNTLNATLYLTNVQLELGSVATSFEYVPISEMLNRCQRYYETSLSGNPWASIGNSWACYATNASYGFLVEFKVTKRATPTISTSSLAWYYQYAPGPGFGLVNINNTYAGVGGVSFNASNTNGLLAMTATQVYPAQGNWTADAGL